MVSFTITEKGYALRGADGQYYRFILDDIEYGPDRAAGAVAIIAAMLLERYRAGAKPLALVSMDNCSHNGRSFAAQCWKSDRNGKRRALSMRNF